MKIEVLIDALPQPRPRFSSGGRIYEETRIKDFKSAVGKAARAVMKEPFTTPLACVIRLYRKFQATSRRFGDCDNLAKSILDSLNKICYNDDAQIVSLTVQKFQATTPKIEIEISPVE